MTFASLMPTIGVESVALIALVAALSSPTSSAAQELTATGAALDVHTHLASQFLVDMLTGGGVPAAGADDLVQKLDEANVRRAIILSAAYLGWPVGLTDDTNVIPENDLVASAVAEYPDRLIGFCGINPLFPSALDEIDRCLALPGMAGIKIHFEGSGIDTAKPADVAALSAVFARAAQLDAPVLMHVADPMGLPLNKEGHAGLAEVLNAHPTVRVVHAHCAGNTDDDTIDIWLRVGASGYHAETSWVEISACMYYYSDAPLAQRELMVWRLRKWGIGHVLFGSDYFALDGETPAETMAGLAKFPFTQEELDTILNNDGSEWLGR
jgi:predicted TIM-barrel fold metal-dependent hydrolase